VITISTDPLVILVVLLLEGPSILGHESIALVVCIPRLREVRRGWYAASTRRGFGLGDGFGLGGLVGHG